MFSAVFDHTVVNGKPRGWRGRFGDIDICGAINETVAKETAFQMNAYRSVAA